MDNKMKYDEVGVPSSDGTSMNSRQNRKRKISNSDTDDITFVTDTSESLEDRQNPCKHGKHTFDVSDRSILGRVIPSKTSDWNEQMFPYLRIGVIPEVSTPYIVFSSYPDFLENQKNKRSEIIASMMNESLAERKVVLDCYNYAMARVLDLEYEHIDHVPVHRVKELYEKTQTLDKIAIRNWINQFEETDSKAGCKKLKEKCKRVHQRLKDFVWQLHYMVNKRRFPEPEELSEGMFQELFLRFAKIFELNLVGVPNVGHYNFDICRKEISSLPDALVVDPCKCNSVFAVVKVNKDYSRESGVETERKVRRTTEVQNTVPPVDGRLKAQHVGDILSALQYSMFGPTGVFGFIVQATDVTVVAFATKENYLECVKQGEFIPEQNCASVRYSEKCNILSKNGRLKLVRTFLEMTSLMKYL